MRLRSSFYSLYSLSNPDYSLGSVQLGKEIIMGINYVLQKNHHNYQNCLLGFFFVCELCPVSLTTM